MPRTRPAYPEEFRKEAVQMVRAGRSAGDVAEALGCSPQSVTNWVKRYERDQGIRSDGLTTDEREELRRLRRENVRLKQERDLLKRAAAFFAADQ
jgi:transposase